ncbi:procathepsin L [Dermacentor silvarum]|uniref:procathepsin L n=1 Tax=Dermacentor silvarum TaxID=543639 RepID=UPI00189BBFD8|nr:procathepsin L [Dermacentor silvarum]XP_049529082.1 procathepsin L [Dermacentor silvarum]XP_049529083.1 procathepsin L [Dermacentor silvarum]
MRGYIVLCSLFVTAAALTHQELIGAEWSAFKALHGKDYDSDTEEYYRLKIYMENRMKIARHNEKYAKNQVSYKLAMNEFGDLLHHEFVSTRNGFKRNYRDTPREGSFFLEPEGVEDVHLPKAIDWRKKGAVTPIKNQGQCGSCWAFSTTGSLEGQHFRKTGKLVSLSEQNLVDCSTSFGNNGCEGGLMDNAFKYIKANKGIDTEMIYPYNGTDGVCHFVKSGVGATDSGFVDIPEGKEDKLKKAVATVGPVSVAIDASHQSFQFYSEGIYDEPECSSEQLDHGVLVVGYGTKDGQDYWLVKNSWGTTWGDEGYIYMTRNKNNQCGIASSASYPLV